MAACSAVASFIARNKLAIEAEGMREESEQILVVVQQRVQGAVQQVMEATQRAREIKEAVSKGIVAKKRGRIQESIFKKYNSKKDGHLSLDDVKAYAKGECNFEIPQANLDRIYRQLVESNGGVYLRDFFLLRTTIGIARDEVAGNERQAKRLEEERIRKEEEERIKNLVIEKKGELKPQVEELLEALGAFGPKVTVSDQTAAKLSEGAQEMGNEQLRTNSIELDTTIKELRAELGELQKRIEKLNAASGEFPELMDAMRLELTKLTSHADVYDWRLQKSGGIASEGSKLARQRALIEQDAFRTEVATKLRICVENQGKKAEELFKIIAKDAQYISAKDIQEFLTQNQCEIDPDMLCIALQSIENHPETQTESAIAPAMPELPALKDGNQAEEKDKKEDGKPAEEKTTEEKPAEEKPAEEKAAEDKPAEEKPAEEKPAEEKSAEDKSVEEKPADEKPADEKQAAEAPPVGGKTPEATKARIHQMKISEDDFTRFLRVYYKVVKTIVLSDSLYIEQSKQIRRMEVGEVMEVSQGPTMDPSIGIYRILGRALMDGVTGWATIAGNQGATFLMPGLSLFKVKKEIVLSEDLRDMEGAKPVKKLEEGQMLEMIEWGRTSRSMLGITRIRARADDGSIGWATMSDNEGNVNLEPT
mmetsp:Transcript_107893/g.292542  ORF Transcript_107893/g.292542 Transcript_107893/m.292542 type:complete len:650 (+) Transcript_107893:216-2165(+)